MGAEHGFVVGDGSQRAAPVLAGDVAAVVAAIDDRRDPIEGVWNLGGPEELTAEEVFRIAGEGGAAVHLDPPSAAARLTELLEIPVSVRTAEFFAASVVSDDGASNAAEVFGIATTPFEGGLRAIAERIANDADRVRRDA